MTTENAAPAKETPKDAATKDPKAAAEDKVKEGNEEVKEEDPDLPMKVYAGNLSFETTEEELKAHFDKMGKIKTVTVVRNNGKHLGYGFVTFETVAEAQKAVTELNKTTLRERDINVQSARSKSETKKKARRPFRSRRGKKKENGAKNGEEGDENEEKEGGEEGEKSKGRKPRGGRRGRGRGGRSDEPRQRGPPSATTVFVANLPFATTDETLEKAFSDAGLQVASAYVVKGKGRFAERSKGFGFVELANQEQQTKAVETMHGKTIEERTISVRVALEKVEHEEDKEGENKENEVNGKVEQKTEEKKEAPAAAAAAA